MRIQKETNERHSDCMPERKYFTLEQANRTLPLVKRVVRDLVNEYALWKERMRRYEMLSATGSTEETEEQRATRRDAQEVAERISGYVEELSAVGCLLKGFDDGLIDFYGKRHGDDVFWCWKLGESRITHWHELNAGLAGRRPLDSESSEDQT